MGIVQKASIIYIQRMLKFDQMAVIKKVLMMVWGLANQDVHHKTGNLFDKFRVGAQCCIMEVCTAVTMYLKPAYVKLPNSSQCVYIAYIASEIEQQSCLPGVSCYLDGAHIHASNGPFMGQK